MSRRQKIEVDEGTREKQAIASNPENTVWVSANAGSGKTHVLVDRVIRLMLNGTEPSRIMCLTFTKAAAAEMAQRLFERRHHGYWLLPRAAIGQTSTTWSPRSTWIASYRLTVGSQCGARNSRRSPTASRRVARRMSMRPCSSPAHV